MVRIIASSGDVDSAMPSYAMWFLSREANASTEVTSAFDAGVAGLLERLRASASQEAAAWLDHFGRFLGDYGARGTGEWDLYYDSWETRPELALALIDRMRSVPDDQSPVARHEGMTTDQQAATAQALTALGDDETAKGTLLVAQGSAQRFVAWRERSKTNCIKVINEMRVALLELGRRMAALGHLAAPKQVFVLTNDELDAFLADPGSFRAVLDKRQAEWEHLFELEPPYFVEGDKGIPPLSSLRPRHEDKVEVAKPGDVLMGAPGCSGVATGRARIITDPGDPLALEPGDVLIAPQTDPSWTPLFVPAAAVVVGVGALNSHAVIVSRELGIPCVVAVDSVSRRIPDGAIVEVDGGAGTVRLL
jgi:pyruvate,water dikinase